MNTKDTALVQSITDCCNTLNGIQHIVQTRVIMLYPLVREVYMYYGKDLFNYLMSEDSIPDCDKQWSPWLTAKPDISTPDSLIVRQWFRSDLTGEVRRIVIFLVRLPGSDSWVLPEYGDYLEIKI
jgi:hypothetical protein